MNLALAITILIMGLDQTCGQHNLHLWVSIYSNAHTIELYKLTAGNLVSDKDTTKEKTTESSHRRGGKEKGPLCVTDSNKRVFLFG